MRPSVYLAGPITGLEYDDAQDWRTYAVTELDDAGIDAFSPLRGKEFLRDHGPLSEMGYEAYPLSSPRGIMTRDRYDCTQRDMVLANLAGSGERISIGTVMEIAWADLARIPVVAVLEERNVHRHAMLLEAAGFIVPDLDTALDIVKAVLLPQRASVIR